MVRSIGMWIVCLWSVLSFFSSPLYSANLPIDPQGNNPYGHLLLEIDRPIDMSVYLYIKSALQYFREQKVKFVILELNTPGGEVFAAQKIAKLLHESDALYQMPVVAYINDWALSAGALLAYSCRYIAISPSASMGAAEPVMMKPNGMESAPEKMNSALRAEFANVAALFGRDPLLAEAMVDKDIFLVRRQGTFVRLETEKELQIGDEIISKAGKLLTLHAKQIEEFGLAQFQVPVSSEGLFAVDPFKELTQRTLIEFSNWKVDFFAFLLHPAITSLLSLGLMLGLYMESTGSGHGMGALVAGLCLGTFLLAHTADRAIESLEMIFLFSGFLLVGLEILFSLTGGALYFLGSLLVIVGLFSMGLGDLGPIHFSFSMDQWNLAAFAVYKALGWFSATFCCLLAFCYLLHVYRISPMYRFLAKEEPEVPSIPSDIKWPSLNSEGKTSTECRPFGRVIVNEEYFEARSEIGFIDKDKNVKIVGIDSRYVIVRSLD